MLESLYQISSILPLQIIAMVISLLVVTILWLYRVILPKKRSYILDNTRFNNSVNQIIACSNGGLESGMVKRITSGKAKKAG